MEYSLETFQQYIKEFAIAQEQLKGVSIAISDGPNQLDPIRLLRFYQSERTLENQEQLANAMCAGKQVGFYHHDEEITRFTVKVGTSVVDYFHAIPWLLDLFFNACYGWVLQALTPPSRVFAKPETESTESSEEMSAEKKTL